MNGAARQAEIELAQRVAASDPVALTLFYERYAGRLYKRLCYKLRCAEDAEDLLQDAMIAALGALPRYRGESNLFTWLCGVTTYVTADWWEKRYRRLDLEADIEIGEFIGAAPSAEDEALRNESAREVASALQGLPGHYQQALVMRYALGLRVQEIMASLGASRRQVDGWLIRGRLALAKALGREPLRAGPMRADTARRLRRQAEIRRLLAERDYSIDELAARFGMAPSMITRDLRQLGLQPCKPNRKRGAARRSEALARVAAGQRQASVARVLGVTEARVSQYVRGK